MKIPRHNGLLAPSTTPQQMYSAETDLKTLLHKKKFHHKTRTGCVRWKHRKVKCDETQPECQRCQKSGFQCSGYNTPQPRIFELPSKPKFESELDKGAFDFFLSEGSAILTTYNPHTRRFWLENAPQLAAEHPAVRHGLIAVGSVQSPLHRSSATQFLSKTRTEMPTNALANLTKPMMLLSSADAKSVSTEVSLACCMIFTTVVLWVDKNAAPIIHIDAVRKIMRDYTNAVGVNPLLRSTVVDEMWAPNNKNMIANAIAFIDAYPPPGSDIWDNWALEFGLNRAGDFSTIGHGFDALNNVIRCIIRLNAGQQRNKAVLERVRSALGTFVRSLWALRPASTSTRDAHAEHDHRSLLMHHKVAIVMLHGVGFRNELAFDQYFRDFSHIVTECEALLQDGENRILKPTLGLLPPLFFTATKCRNGVIRRKALKILHSALRNEVPWTSCVAYRIAQFVIETEGQSQDILDHQIVPAAKRIRLKSVEFRKEEGEMYVRYWKGLCGEEPEVCQTTLPFRSHPSIEKDGFTLQMEHKVLQAYGYLGIMLITPPILCHCPLEAKREKGEAVESN